MSFLKITRTDIKYEMVIKKPVLENVENTNAKIPLRPLKNIKHSDTNLKSSSEFIDSFHKMDHKQTDYFDKGLSSYFNVASYGNANYHSPNISENNDRTKTIYNKIFKNNNVNYVYLPNVGPQISWKKSSDIKSHDTYPSFSQSKTKYSPGSIEFKIIEWPSVKIEYLGDAIYFPKSANPNYQGEE